MSVTITSPTSQLIKRTSGVTLSWESDYPQSAYEVLYRLKGDTAWSTFGKVVSSAQSMELEITSLKDCIEYHYRVIVYSDNSTNNSGSTYYSGSDSSAAYSLILAPDTSGYLKELNDVSTVFKVNVGDKILQAPIVDRDSALSTDFSIKVNGDIKAFGGSSASCEDSGIDEETNLYVSQQYTYQTYENILDTYSYSYSGYTTVGTDYPVYDLYSYPTAITKYDGKLYSEYTAIGETQVAYKDSVPLPWDEYYTSYSYYDFDYHPGTVYYQYTAYKAVDEQDYDPVIGVYYKVRYVAYTKEGSYYGDVKYYYPATGYDGPFYTGGGYELVTRYRTEYFTYTDTKFSGYYQYTAYEDAYGYYLSGYYTSDVSVEYTGYAYDYYYTTGLTYDSKYYNYYINT